LTVNEPGEEPEVVWDRMVAPEPGDLRFTRFGHRDTTEELRLLPAHADRPLVVNVRVPFVLLPGQEVQLYISSPLWLQVELGQRFALAQEIPLFRPSDTWFGPNTLQGELCYASRTGARLEVGNLPIRPQRAISAVEIRNRASSQLRIERLKFPMPNLSIFADTMGHFWTEQLRLDREHDGDDASVRLEKKPPAEVGETKRIAGPRARATKKFLTRAFGRLFDLSGGDTEL
jgi:hypothetical protein